MGLRYFGTYKGRDALAKAIAAAESLPHVPNLWSNCGGKIVAIKGSNPFGVAVVASQWGKA